MFNEPEIEKGVTPETYKSHQRDVARPTIEAQQLINQQNAEGGVHCCSTAAHENTVFWTAANIRVLLTGDPKQDNPKCKVCRQNVGKGQHTWWCQPNKWNMCQNCKAAEDQNREMFKQRFLDGKDERHDSSDSSDGGPADLKMFRKLGKHKKVRVAYAKQ